MVGQWYGVEWRVVLGDSPKPAGEITSKNPRLSNLRMSSFELRSSSSSCEVRVLSGPLVKMYVLTIGFATLCQIGKNRLLPASDRYTVNGSIPLFVVGGSVRHNWRMCQ